MFFGETNYLLIIVLFATNILAQIICLSTNIMGDVVCLCTNILSGSTLGQRVAKCRCISIIVYDADSFLPRVIGASFADNIAPALEVVHRLGRDRVIEIGEGSEALVADIAAGASLSRERHVIVRAHHS